MKKAVFAIAAASVLSSTPCFCFDLVGHRGDPRLAPQNSIESFKLAWENSTYVEMDFHEIADGSVICIHEQGEWEKVTGKKQKIETLTLEEVKEADLGNYPEWKGKYKDVRIPTVDEVFAAVPKGKIVVMHIKNYTPSLDEKIEAARVRHNLDESQLVFYGGADAVKSYNAKHKGRRSVWATGFFNKKPAPSADEVVETCRRIGATAFSTWWREGFLNAEYVSKVRSAGVEFWTWGEFENDDFNRILELRDMGVQLAMTNRAGEFQKRLKDGREGEKSFDFLAHRGEPRLAPQNSIESFKLAWKNSTYAEGDFHEIADGSIICIHTQGEWERVSGGKRKIATLTLEEAKTADLARYNLPEWKGKYKDVKIPTMDEVFSVIPKGKVLFFEIKTYSPDFAEKVEAARKRHNLDKSQIVFVSFGKEIIKSVNSKLEGYKSFWITEISAAEDGSIKPSPEEAVKICRDIGADGISMGGARIKLLDAEYVSKIRSAGLDFCAWTVNDFKFAMKLRGMGVHLVTSDTAGKFQKLLRGGKK